MSTLRNDEVSCYIDFETKRQRIQLNEEPLYRLKKTELLDLSDDCIELVCARLQLDDLCSFSLTCKRVHKVANRHFYRQYKSHHMEIVNTLAGPQHRKTEELYVKCFKSNIRNIRITSDYVNLSLTSLLTFIRINCCEHLRSLEFNTIDLRRIDGSCIRGQLANLETVSFVNCWQFDIHKGFLRHCGRLKHLVVKQEMETETNCGWMLHVYPNLETLVYSDRTRLDVTEPMLSFFQLNPHIKRLACSDFRILRCITNLDITLDCLHYLDSAEELGSVTEFLDVLKILCDEKCVHRLRLEFGYHFNRHSSMIYDGLISLTAVLYALSLTMQNVSFLKSARLLRHRFENVKYLSLKGPEPISKATIHRIVKTLPNLVQIHLNLECVQDTSTIVYDFLGIAVTTLKSLETFVVYRICATDIYKLSIICLSLSRMKLKDACPLTIYLPYEITKAIIQISTRSLVSVKPISALKCETPLCNIRIM